MTDPPGSGELRSLLPGFVLSAGRMGPAGFSAPEAGSNFGSPVRAGFVLISPGSRGPETCQLCPHCRS